MGLCFVNIYCAVTLYLQTLHCCLPSGAWWTIKWWSVTTATANNSFTSLLPPQLFVVTRILDNEWLIIWTPKSWQIYNTDDQKTAENISNVENISVSRAAHRYMCRPGADCGRGMGRAGRDNQNTAAAWRERGSQQIGRDRALTRSQLFNRTLRCGYNRFL